MKGVAIAALSSGPVSRRLCSSPQADNTNLIAGNRIGEQVNCRNEWCSMTVDVNVAVDPFDSIVDNGLVCRCIHIDPVKNGQF